MRYSVRENMYDNSILAYNNYVSKKIDRQCCFSYDFFKKISDENIQRFIIYVFDIETYEVWSNEINRLNNENNYREAPVAEIVVSDLDSEYEIVDAELIRI